MLTYIFVDFYIINEIVKFEQITFKMEIEHFRDPSGIQSAHIIKVRCGHAFT